MDERTPGYYAIIPATVRYDDQIPANAKLLYGEILALLNADGICFASNQYFAELYGVTVKSISRLISALEDAGYISLEIERNKSGQVANRKISINVSTTQEHPVDNFVLTNGQNCGEGMDKNVQYTNISLKENIKESPKEQKQKNSRAPKTDFDPRPLFVNWIDTELPKITGSGVIANPHDKNALYMALVNFTENRHAMKKPIPSKAAVTALLNRLIKFTDNAAYRVDAMIDLLETATSSNWQTVYAHKDRPAKTQKTAGRVFEEL